MAKSTYSTSTALSRSFPPSLSSTCSLTVFAFACTQSATRGLNCYHMVAIARTLNTGKTVLTTEKWETEVQSRPKTGGEERNQVTAETEKPGDNYWVSHLYMRSMSISGSSWNSLIFTVSDKILLRFLRSSSTWKYKPMSSCVQRLLFYACFRRVSLYLGGQLSVVHLCVLLSVHKDSAEGPS